MKRSLYCLILSLLTLNAVAAPECPLETQAVILDVTAEPEGYFAGCSLPQVTRGGSLPPVSRGEEPNVYYSFVAHVGSS